MSATTKASSRSASTASVTGQAREQCQLAWKTASNIWADSRVDEGSSWRTRREGHERAETVGAPSSRMLVTLVGETRSAESWRAAVAFGGESPDQAREHGDDGGAAALHLGAGDRFANGVCELVGSGDLESAGASDAEVSLLCGPAEARAFRNAQSDADRRPLRLVTQLTVSNGMAMNEPNQFQGEVIDVE